MASVSLEEATRMVDQLPNEDQRSLIQHLAQRLWQASTGAPTDQEARAPQDLYGVWRGFFPEDLDIDAILKEVRLGVQAKQAFDEGAHGTAVIFLSAIVLAELYYMNEKLGRPLDFITAVQRLNQSSQFVLVPFLPADTLGFVVDQAVTEMHDRIIVGVARRMNAVLLTRDSQIVGSNLVPILW